MDVNTYPENALFMTRQELVEIRSAKSADGRYLWKPGTSVGERDTYNDRPIFETDGIDRRQYAIERPEIREEGDQRFIEGLAVPYNRWTTIGAWFREKFEPGAFRAYLTDPDSDVRYNYGHERNSLMGRRRSGTLTVWEREDGLYVRLEVPNTTLGRDMIEMIRRGDIQGHSIEFYAKQETWRYADADGNEDLELDERIVTEATLPGVALVADPAYEDASAALRSRELSREQAPNQPGSGDAGAGGETEARMRRLRLARAHADMDGLG